MCKWTFKKFENINYCKKFMYITEFFMRNFEDSTAIAQN